MSRRALAEIAAATLLLAVLLPVAASGWVRDTSFRPSPDGMRDAARHDVSLILEANAFEIASAEAGDPYVVDERNVVPVVIDVAPNARTAGQDLPAATVDVVMEHRWCMASFRLHTGPRPQPEPRDGP